MPLEAETQMEEETDAGQRITGPLSEDDAPQPYHVIGEEMPPGTDENLPQSDLPTDAAWIVVPAGIVILMVLIRLYLTKKR